MSREGRAGAKPFPRDNAWLGTGEAGNANPASHALQEE